MVKGNQRTWISVTRFAGELMLVQKQRDESVKQKKEWSPGDWAVYRKSKRSFSPGPRAYNIMAASKGDSYTYVVEKFWVVESVTSDNEIRLRTARGKTNRISLDDPNLRRPSWFQRIVWRARFRQVEATVDHTQFAA